MQKDKRFTFEDPKASSSTGSATSAAAQEWMDAIERAIEVAQSQSVANSYAGSEIFGNLAPPMSRRGTSGEVASESSMEPGQSSSARSHLQKNPSSRDGEELKGFKRFSKRTSKSGLAAVF